MDSTRSILEITGDDRVHFLQGILTQDVARLAEEKIQFSALLSPQGKILHDMLLVDFGTSILIDTPGPGAELLKKRLAMYRLRAQVAIADATGVAVSIGEGLPDPRHPALPRRRYALLDCLPGDLPEPDDAATRAACLALGIPECGRDFAPDRVVAMDAGYDLLHAISFTKGCYVGQEIVARMHYKAIARRGFYLLENDAGERRLALLKFEEAGNDGRAITLDSQPWRATLPAWMQPKYAQYDESREKQ